MGKKTEEAEQVTNSVTETVNTADVLQNDTMDVVKDDNSEVKEEDISAMMYSHLSELFGGSNQLFTMEFPGRVLNENDFLYDIKDYNGSTLNKPYSVAENEFFLSDNMVDPYPIVSGPNGKSLSMIYGTAINNFAPKIIDVKEYITDKMELRLFLLQPVTDRIDDEVITCSS